MCWRRARPPCAVLRAPCPRAVTRAPPHAPNGAQPPPFVRPLAQPVALALAPPLAVALAPRVELALAGAQIR